ncbi:MAG: aminoacyl-tRNA hydrolase [Sedimentisphaerales bacterium]|nr:aminoacyl-tRNA hydrolase [Sedimentisphaerales bacterium]
MGLSSHIKKLVFGKSDPEVSFDTSKTMMIVGLGNPGKKYQETRHNVGFETIDLLALHYGIEVDRKKFGALYGQCQSGDTKLILLKPQKYMNLSGHVIATAAGFFKLDIENIIVVTDDMALVPGMIRIRKRGSAGGHNGLKDIIARLGTEEFARLRIGVGKNELQDAASFVLSRPGREEKDLIREGVKKAAEAVICWIKEGVEAAMNKFNVRNNENENITKDNK